MLVGGDNGEHSVVRIVEISTIFAMQVTFFFGMKAFDREYLTSSPWPPANIPGWVGIDLQSGNTWPTDRFIFVENPLQFYISCHYMSKSHDSTA